MRRSNVLLACAFLATACGSDLPKNPEVGAPVIQTASPLPDAVYDMDYLLELEWSGGQEPFTFTIEAPSALGWLTIDGTLGILSGRPEAVVDPGVEFTVTVTDSLGQSDAKVFTLAVAKCNEEGLEVDCFTVDTFKGQCLQNTALCTNGTFATCEPGKPSQRLDHCGTNAIGSACGSCSPGADNCNGTCQCGSGPACSGDKATCCNGTCLNTASGDMANCGGCGVSCSSAKADNCNGGCKCGSSPACSGGKPNCCSGGCVNTGGSDTSNCGSCGHVCSTPSGALWAATCNGGGCRWYGKVTSTSGVKVRSSPHVTSTNEVGTVNWGNKVTIDCLAHGDQISGDTATDIWFHIVAGGSATGYISGAYTNVGSGTANIPNC